MAGKKVKVEDSEDKGAELINSPNEEAEERRAVAEVLGFGNPDAKSQANDVLAWSVEGTMKGVSFVDDDAEPRLLQEDTGPSDLFPGVPCVTVAKRCKKGNDDPAPMFLNRYGPRAKGWFVWATTPYLPDGTSVENLQNVGERHHRVLDYPREQGKPRYRASNVHGILNIVWDCNGLEQSPEDAAELLNPANVKRADKLPTSKSRRDWLHKNMEKRLDKYRITHVDVKFHQKINGVTKRPETKGQGDLYSNWELASQYKALYRKDQVKAEWRVYEAAKLQAKRFLEWYAERHPGEFSEYRRSQSREPTVQPFKRSSQTASPEATESTDTTPSPEYEAPGARKSTTMSSPTPTKDSRATPASPSQFTPPSTKADIKTDVRKDAGTSQDLLSKDDFKEAVLEGYCAARGIASPEAMTPKQKMKFEVYFDVYAKDKGY